MHHSGLKPDAWYCNQGSIFEGPWILDDYQKRKRMWKEWVLTRHGAANRKKVLDHYRAKKKKRRFAPGRDVGWDSDDDNVIDTAGVGVGMCEIIRFLGFHPYKEVIFLDVMGDPVACHLGSGKVQYLGVLHPGCYNRGSYEAFVYTPCLIGV